MKHRAKTPGKFARSACNLRMSRAGNLLEAAKNAEAASKQMMHFALAEFADARRALKTAKAQNVQSAASWPGDVQ